MTEAPAGSRLSRLLPRALWRRLALPFVALIGAVLLVLAFAQGDGARDAFADRLVDELMIDALVLRDVISDAEAADIEGMLENVDPGDDRRLALIGPDGGTVWRSDAGTAVLGDLPETRSALAGRVGQSVREESVAVTVPLRTDAGLILRIEAPLDGADAIVEAVRNDLLVAAGVAILLAGAIAVVIGMRLTAQLDAIRSLARRVAAGDLEATVPPSAILEIDAVGDALNAMTARLSETRADLERTRTRLEAVLAGFGDGVVLTDARGHVLRLNRAAEALLSIRDDRAAGRPFIQVARDHDLDLLLQGALTGATQVPQAVEHGLNRRTLLSSASRVEGASEYLGLVVLRDISDLRRLEGVRREFVANVSHELRTPLTSIRAMVETMEMGAVDDPAMVDDMLRRIVQEVDRLTALVEDLLDLARLESGRSAVALEQVPAADLVRAGALRLLPQTERARLDLRFELDVGLPVVLADRRGIEQVLLNLIHNAIKFTAPGGSITVSAEVRGDRVHVRVTDTGIGIAESELPRLFERFYKADKARNSEGTGLGLAIAKHIVQSHGGEIGVESRVGRGSTFSFSVPVAGSVAGEVLLARHGPAATPSRRR